MERKISKQELRAVRKVLGMTQTEFGDFIGVSKVHINRTEHNGKTSYDVSESLSNKVKERVKDMGLNLEEIIKVGLEILEND